MTSYEELGLKFNYLYEILATTFSLKSKKKNMVPNTSCMGIRLINESVITLSPYPNTTTFKNLKEHRIITLNFVDDIYLYALAALKKINSNSHFVEFPSKYYNYYNIEENKLKFNTLLNLKIPYIKKSWGVIFCEVYDEKEIIKKDGLGKLKLSEFTLNVLSIEKLKESYKLFNRAENLALEIILLATRLKIVKEKSEVSLYNKINNKIINYIENVKRFGKNGRALKAINLVENYIRSIMD